MALAQKDAMDTGVEVRWQGVALRFAADAEQQIRDYYKHIDANRDVWVGINMAGREDDNRGYQLGSRVFLMKCCVNIQESGSLFMQEKPKNQIAMSVILCA